jgi:hypothetical protein
LRKVDDAADDCGLEEISGGTLKIGDQIVNERDPKQRNIAMVFQNYAIYPHVSVRENIGFGLYTSRLPREEKPAYRGGGPGAGPDALSRPPTGGFVRRSAPARRHRPRHGA